jgi:hypothetical protein
MYATAGITVALLNSRMVEGENWQELVQLLFLQLGQSARTRSAAADQT